MIVFYINQQLNRYKRKSLQYKMMLSKEKEEKKEIEKILVKQEENVLF